MGDIRDAEVDGLAGRQPDRRTGELDIVMIEDTGDFHDVAFADRFVGTGADEGDDYTHDFPALCQRPGRVLIENTLDSFARIAYR